MALLKKCFTDNTNAGGMISMSMFDIIFMDNIMTTMNGPEAAEAIRALGYRGKIVGLTGM